MLQRMFRGKQFQVALKIVPVLLLACASVAVAAEAETAKEYGLIGSLFKLLGDQPFLFIMISLALGYPLGKLRFAGVTLGSTAGTLVVGLVLANIAFLGFDIRYEIPGILQTLALMLFMYAIGLRVGPQFFSGLARNGFGLIMIAVIIVVLNWVICVGGAWVAGLAPGFATGIISGSFTVTAVLGVAQSAVDVGAFTPPDGMTADVIGANMAAGYAISYVLSSVFIILMIKYLPKMFGHDPVAEGKKAEQSYGGGEGAAPLPGSDESFVMGYAPVDIRAYRLENEELIGKTPWEIFEKYDVPVLRVVRDGEWMDVEKNMALEKGDVITVRADVDRHITSGGEVGPEVADEQSRNIELEVVEVVVSDKAYAGRTLQEIGKEMGYGLHLKALFREGVQLPHLPETVVEVGDVLRLMGTAWVINFVAEKLGTKPVRATTVTEVTSMAIAMSIGFAVGLLSIRIGGIPFSLGTSAGVILAGILVSTLRSRNPMFGGPVNEGARSLLQDIGLNIFIAVLAANVGPKIIQSFNGPAVLWIAGIGLIAALLPAFIAWLFGYYILKMNPVVLAGACAGGRNSTPAMRGIQDESKSVTPAIGYPVPYAVSTILVLIGGYLSMVLS